MLKNWITYYLFLLSSLVFALLYPGTASSALFYALLVTPLVSLGLSSLLLSGFRYEQRIDAVAASKGDTVTLRVTAGNRGVVMLPYVELSFYGDGSALGRDLIPRVLAVTARRKASFTVKLACRYKGTYEVGVRQIRFKDYLGLFTFRQNVAKLGDLTVYPRIVPVGAFPVLAGYAGEANTPAGRSHERTETVSDIRKYASGDRLRSIHWKLSAKKDELMVKNFEQASGSCVELVLDASGIQPGPEALELEDRFVECAVALAYHFARNSIPAVLHAMGDGLVRQRVYGMNDFRLALRMLAETSFSPGRSLPDIAELVQGEGTARKTVAIVTAGLSPETLGQAQKLAACGCSVSVVHALAAAEGAQEETKEMAEALRAAGVPYYPVGADEDIGAALARKAG